MTTIERLRELGNQVGTEETVAGAMLRQAATELEALQAENAALRAKLEDNGERGQRRDAAVSWLERNGYRYCDIPACNCGSYHQTEKFTPWP